MSLNNQRESGAGARRGLQTLACGDRNLDDSPSEWKGCSRRRYDAAHQQVGNGARQSPGAKACLSLSFRKAGVAIIAGTVREGLTYTRSDVMAVMRWNNLRAFVKNINPIPMNAQLGRNLRPGGCYYNLWGRAIGHLWPQGYW